MRIDTDDGELTLENKHSEHSELEAFADRDGYVRLSVNLRVMSCSTFQCIECLTVCVPVPMLPLLNYEIRD